MVLASWVTRVPYAADRVDVERLGQRELFFAVDVESEHGVGAGVAKDRGEIASGQFEVLRVSAVAVEDGRNLAFSACPAGRAFTGLGPHQRGEFVDGISHGVAPGSGFLARPGARQLSRVPVDNGGSQEPPSP
jgi:hypothetical protein